MVETRPHGLQAAVDGDGVVTLSWNAPDVRVSEYRILRHRPEEGEPEPLVYVEWTESKDTNFSDTEVEPGVLYVYQVERIDVFGYAHDASEPASVRVPVPGSDSPGLAAHFESIPESHDGTSAFTLRLGFSEAVDITATALRDVLAVSGGTVSQVAQVDGRSDLWEVTVMPSSADDVEIRLSPSPSCGAGSVCTEAGVPLSNIYAVLIPGPAQPAGDSPATANQETEPAGEATDRPHGLQAAIDGDGDGDGVVTLSWNAPDIYVSEYRILRHRPEEGEPEPQVYVEFTGSKDTNFSDTGVEPGVLYVYQVQATDVFGFAGDASEPVSVRAPESDSSAPASAESTTVQVQSPDPEALTAAFEGLPEAHDGEGSFHFRVAFSEDIGIGFRSMRDASFTVDGGEVTAARRVDRRNDLWRITVAPDGEGDVTVTLAAGRECAVSGAICTRGENRRQLANTPAATVAGPVDEAAPAALTASFAQAPDEHDGETTFKLRIAFSEGISISFRTFRDQSLSVSGGSVAAAKRVDRRRDLWEITVEPDTHGAVTVTLEGERACGTAGAVCTGDGRALSATISTTVRGPMALAVADARVREGTDETIDFTVSLSRAASGSVTVDYATADGTATAGSDYTARSGTLTFAAGETAKTVAVPVLDDVVDEGEETLTFLLSNATGARIADGTAAGTIANKDPLLKVSLSRFGRTVADHVVDAVTARLSAPSGGSQVTLGGQSIDLSAQSDGADDSRGSPGRWTRGEVWRTMTGGPGRGAWEASSAGSWAGPETDGARSRTLTGRELLLGSSFHLASGGGEAGGPGFAAWGRMTVGGFDAEAPAETGKVRLDGEVTTGVLGADAAWEHWLAGVALSVSNGEDKFDQPNVDSGSGTIESTLTSVNPYFRYEASDRLSAWGLLGYGTGDMTMTARGKPAEMTDISMRLGAAGARGVLLEADETGGIDLALRGDAFLVQMDWEKVSAETDTRADASRLRLVLEGNRAFALGEGAVLTPGLEVGLRHDGGDAETGTGVEVGGRIRYADTGSGLTVEANARTLVAHEDSDYEEWGAGGSVRLDPGASGRGLSLSLAPVWGTPSSGVDRLWSARDTAGLATGDEFEAERRLEGEVGYGFGAFGERGLVTPYAGLGLAEAGDRTWRAGARWSLAPALAMSLDGARREPANDDATEHGVRFRFTLHW